MEILPSKGESPKDRKAHDNYLKDVERGKSALQLDAVKKQMTSEIRNNWSPRSFTDVKIPSGQYDATVCNVSYHFHKHGQKYGNIRAYTLAAKKYLEQNKAQAKPDSSGVIKLPKGTFDKDGRIITFSG
jgi:hypothetical protein